MFLPYIDYLQRIKLGLNYVCVVTHIARVCINWVRLPILLVVNWENECFPARHAVYIV